MNSLAHAHQAPQTGDAPLPTAADPAEVAPHNASGKREMLAQVALRARRSH